MDTNLINNLLCLVSICVSLIGFVVFGALLAWIITRQWRPKDQATLAAEGHVVKSQVGGLAAGLRPWSAEALADLSTDWDASWSKFGRELSARGTIPGLSDPKGPDWVAFALKVRGARQPEGLLEAGTTSQAVNYRISQAGITVAVDGIPWGSVQPDGVLLNVDGEVVGSAPRPGGMPAKFHIGSAAVLSDRRERTYPVTLGERVVAHMSNPPAQMTNVISLKKREFPPAVSLAGTLSDEEATWLLVLAILQVAFYNLLETVWTN